MAALKNRQVGIPEGIKFIQPETGWAAPRYASFQVVCNMLKAHRDAHPDLVKKYNWATDPEGIAEDIEQYNVNVCIKMGWLDYIVGDIGASPPKSRPLSSLRGQAANVAAGANVLVEWIASGAEAVDQALAHGRAGICAQCPQNKTGDMLSFFTKPVSEAIRAALNTRNAWKLETIHDRDLGVCAVCNCPLKLKVHVPIAKIKARLGAETLNALPGNCWIPKE